jgi:hypothetical protein
MGYKIRKTPNEKRSGTWEASLVRTILVWYVIVILVGVVFDMQYLSTSD